MKTPISVRGSTSAAVTPMKSSGIPRRALSIVALMAAWLGLNATLTAQPVTVPDFSFEQTVFPAITNILTPGGTEGFNNIPLGGWWGSGSSDQTETNGQSFVEPYPTVYIQNADSTN